MSFVRVKAPKLYWSASGGRRGAWRRETTFRRLERPLWTRLEAGDQGDDLRWLQPREGTGRQGGNLAEGLTGAGLDRDRKQAPPAGRAVAIAQQAVGVQGVQKENRQDKNQPCPPSHTPQVLVAGRETLSPDQGTQPPRRANRAGTAFRTGGRARPNLGATGFRPAGPRAARAAE
ncbi:hypothetical protein DYH09_15105 [bacterium CPR1]|nr:hypothetical protein [bacterium CPR1]